LARRHGLPERAHLRPGNLSTPRQGPADDLPRSGYHGG
jgi:hypothetical protein